MSMNLMAKAMSIKVGSSLRKLVLIKLADNANDLGECWPSYQHIAEQCETSRRSVIRAIKELEEQGLLRIEERRMQDGNNKSNVYYLNLFTSDNMTPPSDRKSPPPVTHCHPPSDPMSPPLVTQCHPEPVIIEPVIEPINNITPHSTKVTKKSKPKLDLSCFTEQPSEEVWKDFIQHRKNLRAALTQTAVNRLANQINQANANGYATDEVLSIIQERGWRGFEYQWLENGKSNFKAGNRGKAQSEDKDLQAWINGDIPTDPFAAYGRANARENQQGRVIDHE